MPNQERERLARMCRGQAALASTEGVRAVLIELAEMYEAEGPERLTVAPMESLPKQPE